MHDLSQVSSLRQIWKLMSRPIQSGRSMVAAYSCILHGAVAIWSPFGCIWDPHARMICVADSLGRHDLQLYVNAYID